MLSKLIIQNYKSIDRLELSLGRMNLFIGENGAGKSNILEAIALAGAANAGKLDNEFLSSRGIRVCDPELMRSCLKTKSRMKAIKILVEGTDDAEISIELSNDNEPYSSWQAIVYGKLIGDVTLLTASLKQHLDALPNSKERKQLIDNLLKQLNAAMLEAEQTPENSEENRIPIKLPFQVNNIEENSSISALNNFLIYSPEYSSLSSFEKEGQIQPLGIRGEGLLERFPFILHHSHSLRSSCGIRVD